MVSMAPVKMSANPASMDVSFEWSKENFCSNDNPEITVGRVPEQTNFLRVSLYNIDNQHPDISVGHDHGGAFLPYDGSGVIPAGAISDTKSHLFRGPCPMLPGNEVGSDRYVLSVIALDADKTGIGVGKAARECCRAQVGPKQPVRFKF